MKIMVFIKQVPGTDNVKMNPETGTMVRTGSNNVINPLDENALEEALSIKRQVQDAVVTAISMGPLSARKALNEAIALGADAGVLLSSRAFAGSDTIATARVLSAAVRKLGGADLVLCGERATDGETGQTGPMIAEMLGLPVITFVKRIQMNGDRAVVERMVENGFERVEVPFPFLATVIKDINEPSFPTLAGKLRAGKAEVPVWEPGELGLDNGKLGLAGSPTRVVKVFSPKLARNTRLLKQDGSGQAVRELLKVLREKEVI
jgi:electron transfer flavoprotein beta subunit